MVVIVSGSEQMLALLATRHTPSKSSGKKLVKLWKLQLSMDGISINILLSRKIYAEFFSEKSNLYLKTENVIFFLFFYFYIYI